MPHESPATILITRLSHIGDCILTLPLAIAIREQMPAARIAWVVEPPADELLGGHAAIDHLVIAERGWRKSWSKYRRLRGRLRELRPSVSLDPQGLTKSAILAWASGAPRRIGPARPHAGELAPWLNREHVAIRQVHLVDRTLALLEPLQLRRGLVRFELPRHAESEGAMHAILRERHLLDGYYVINPGASWPSKRWPPSSFAVVAKELGQRYQLPALVTWAGRQEQELAVEIVERSGGHAILAPPTNLRELLAVLRQARYYLGSDTGPMHMAAAVQTPCVALFGPTRPEASGPYGEGHICLQAYYQAGSRRARRKGSDAAMRAIEVDSVVRACEDLICSSEPALDTGRTNQAVTRV